LTPLQFCAQTVDNNKQKGHFFFVLDDEDKLSRTRQQKYLLKISNGYLSEHKTVLLGEFCRQSPHLFRH